MINDVLKDKLIGALKSSVNYYNDGMSSTDAVVKSAGDAKFNIDQTERLVEMFNTAKTIHHFNKHAKDDHKSDAFELCDGNQVILSLFDKLPSSNKSIDSVKQSIDITDRDYSFYNKAAQDELLNVNVINGISGNETPVDFSVDGLTLDNQITRANKAIHNTRDVAKHAASVVAQLQESASANLMKVADDLRREYEDVACGKLTRLAGIIKNDDKLKNTIDKFASFIPSYLKAAFDNPANTAVVDDSDLKGYLSLIKEASHFLIESNQLEQEQNELIKVANSFEKDMYDTISQKEKEGSGIESFFLIKKAQLAPTTPKQDKEPDKGKNIFEVAGQIGQTYPGTAVDTFFKGVGDQATKGLDSLLWQKDVDANKQINNRLRDAHRTVILQDLIINDPVIGDVDPQVVAKAYNAIIQTAPDVSLNKEVTRSLLRQTVHSLAVSPYDAEQWLNLEKIIKEVSGTLPPQKRMDIKQR